MIIAKVVNDFSIGEYTVIINHNNNTVTTIIDKNIFMYEFNKDIIISYLLEISPEKDINDFIVDILGLDEKILNDCMKLIKSI